jgi:hypothetical protein
MTFDLQKILESKRAYRQSLAALPIAEKLRILDALRERALAIRGETEAGRNASKAEHRVDHPINNGRNTDRN